METTTSLPSTASTKPGYPSGKFPSSQRVEPGSVNVQAAPWPASSKAAADTDADATARSIVSAFNDALSSGDYSTLAGLFLPNNSFWRDHLVLSWDLRTFQGPDKIADFLARPGQEGGCLLSRIELDNSGDVILRPKVTDFKPSGGVMGIQAFLTLTTTRGAGRGLVRLVQDEESGEWKIWTLYTVLESLSGHEEAVGRRRPMGVQHGGLPGRRNWLDERKEEMEFKHDDPEVLIIGAGQSGLSVHARLKMLNVRALIIERAAAVGDNWRNRYHQLVLHDPVYFDHLPYMPFPETWPVFTPKDKLADWFALYASTLELNVWTRSELESAAWDDAAKVWTVAIRRSSADRSPAGEARVLRPRHIILCTGHSGEKHMPAIPGIDSFQGDLLCHSSEFQGAREQGGGGAKADEEHGHANGNANGNTNKKKKAVVVGACNSSHDICQDYYEKGYDVTMVQRSSTLVRAVSQRLGPYMEGGIPTDDADLSFWSWPAAPFKRMQTDVTVLYRAAESAVRGALAAGGFATDEGPDDGGLFVKYLQRGAGYYINVGASPLVADGRIRLASGRSVTAVTPRGVQLADGTELEADEVVFATGYANMRTQARRLLGDAVADSLTDVWGWDAEGEMRGMYRASGHPGFWFHCGNLAMTRYFSRLLALQIKAQLLGLYKA